VVEEQKGELMLISPRDLTARDISSAMELSTAAGWNQITEDWNRILRLSPHGCRCIEAGGQVIATTTLLPYGTGLGWVGMVLTRPEHRRQGLAKRLMEDAIENAKRGGIRTMKLDATDEGRPLYESLGFVTEAMVERWGRDMSVFVDTDQKQNSDSLLSSESKWCRIIPNTLLAMDEKAFGVSRAQILEELSELGGTSSDNGYVLSRSGRTARSLGPCVAISKKEAKQLIAKHLDSHKRGSGESEVWYWDLLPENGAAVESAKSLGFTRRRILWRMRRGDPIRNNDAMVFATAGFELG
jgi:GNAT superfamily N-acetyltransferase